MTPQELFQKGLSEHEKSIAWLRARQAEYPSLQEQLDMQYHDAQNGTTVWQDTIAAIKLKYPKPL